jgi:hypothetical protein
MIEKRAFPRLSRDWEIDYQIYESQSSQPIRVKGEFRDLSRGGFCFRTEWSCPPGSFFPFAITPKDDFKPLIGVARIAWTRDMDSCFECGAAFAWVNWRDIDPQTAIGEYIVDQLAKKQS